MTKRIYVIQSKAGKKKIYVNAASKNQALRYVMSEYFTCAVATHEDLMAAFKQPGTEIVEVSPEPDEVDIEEVTNNTGDES